MFQDHGAAGRMPVLIPVTWKQDPDSPEGKKLPVFGDNGKMPKKIEVASIRPDYQYKSLFTSDIFDKESEKAKIHPLWQWNHEPDQSLWRRTEDGGLAIKTGKISLYFKFSAVSIKWGPEHFCSRHIVYSNVA